MTIIAVYGPGLDPVPRPGQRGCSYLCVPAARRVSPRPRHHSSGTTRAGGPGTATDSWRGSCRGATVGGAPLSVFKRYVEQQKTR